MPLKLTKKKERKNWYIRGTHLGIAVHESTKTDRRGTAERVLARKIVEVERRAFNLETPDDDEKPELTFVDAVAMYIDAGGDDRFLTPLIGYFRHTLMNDIGQREVDAAARGLYPRGKPATRVRNVYVPLSAIRSLGADNGLCEAKRIRRPKVVKVNRKPAPPEWIVALLPHCNERLSAMILFMNLTGARVGEALALTWDDVDLNRAEALIKQTKINQLRLVDLPSVLVAAIANIEGRKGKVFGYTNRSSVYNAVRRACKKAKLPYYSTHQFGRHAMATEMLKRNFTVKHVQEAGGWKSERLVLETYGHLERSDLKAARDELADAISVPNPGQTKKGMAK